MIRKQKIIQGSQPSGRELKYFKAAMTQWEIRRNVIHTIDPIGKRYSQLCAVVKKTGCPAVAASSRCT
jgi:butyrate kinase